MADHGVIFNFLTESELQNLPEPVREKLQTELEVSKNRFEELEVKNERLKVDAGQRCFELEKLFVTSNSLYQEENKKNVVLNQKLDVSDKKCEEKCERVELLEQKAEAGRVEKVQLLSANQELNSEKNDLSSQLEKKLKQIDNLQDEWKSMSEKIGSANSAKLEAQTKLEEIKSKEMSIQFQQQGLEKEKERLDQNNLWLDGELSSKTKELFTIRKDLSSRVLGLNSSLDEKTEELTRAEDTLTYLKKVMEGQSKKMDVYVERLKECRDVELKSEEQFKKELQARDKLIKIYQTASEEQEHKTKELLSAVSELQKLLHSANDVAKETADEKEELEKQHEQMLAERDEKIAEIEKELDVANGMITTGRKRGMFPLSTGDIETLSPTAAAASKLLKSGKTLTQIYSEYVTATEQLQMEKFENSRLNQYLDTILQDIEEKAPRMKKQREDYEQALLTVNHLTNQLDAAMMEVEKLRLEAEDTGRRCNQYQREVQRHKQQTTDLGRQVKYLIKELEEARGGRVSTVHDEADLSKGEVTSSSQIITDKLVTFRNIEELQEQNQRLLQVVRELSEKNESDERKAVEDKTLTIQEELKVVKEKLEEHSASRSRQAEMFESVVRQRDMYSVLLAQSGSSIPGNMPPYPSTPLHSSTPRHGGPAHPVFTTSGPSGHIPDSPGSVRTELDLAKDALKELGDNYDHYKKDRRDNDKMLTDQVEKLKEDLSEMRVQNAKLSSQLDYSLERFKIVQTNAESSKKEITAIREKNQQYTTSVVKHEQTINTLREDLMALQTRLTRTDVEAQNVRAQLSLARTSESRLVQERETLQRERHSQTILLANLEAIQNNLERQEFETKTKSSNQLASLEKEVTELSRRLASTDGERKAVRDMLQKDVDDQRKRYTEEVACHRTTKQECNEMLSQNQKLQQELLAAQGTLKVTEARVAKLTKDPKIAAQESSVQNEAIEELKAQVENLQQEKRELTLKLRNSEEHCEQYQSISHSIEENLKEQNKASDEFKQSLETRMDAVQEENEVMVTRCQNMEKECHDLLQENIRISEESYNLNAELRKQLSTMQTELEEATSRREEAILKENSARKDCQDQVKLAQDAQDKYERELILHAANMEILRSTKEELSGFNMKLVKSEAEARAAQTELEAQKKSWQNLEELLKDEKTNLEKQCQELREQNEVLHDQMEKLSTQVVTVQQMAGENTKLDFSLSDESTKSNDQLLEVIRFLRREKEISDTKFQVTSAENARLEQRITSLSRQVNDLTESMVDDRQTSQMNIVAAMEHAELMKKVENLNLLTDSNKLLREEKDRFLNQLRETEEKYHKLEVEFVKTQSSVRDQRASKDAADQDKVSLQSELERWKARVNNLIEQSDKADPEERKRLINEREEIRKELNQTKEELTKLEHVRTDLGSKFNNQKDENAKIRAELSRNVVSHSNTLSSKQNEIIQHKNQEDKLKNEIIQHKHQEDKLKKELDSAKSTSKTQTDDIDEKNTMINQLKRLGRKYKTQVEEVTKELEQARKERDDLESAKSEQTATEARVNSLTQQVEALKAKCENLEKEKQTNEAEQAAKNADREALKVAIKTAVNEVTSQLEETQANLTIEKEAAQKAREEVAQAQAAETKVRNSHKELDKKLELHKDMLHKVKTKITSQKIEITALSQENDQLKQKVDGDVTDKNDTETERTQLSGRISELETLNKDLVDRLECVQSKQDEYKKNFDLSMSANEDLQRKFNQLLQSKQGVMKVTSAQVERAIRDIQSAPSKATPRANIQPMSSPSPTATRQSAPVQPSTRATASIRPMAMTSHSPAPSTSTPTATVMPLQDQGSSSSDMQELEPLPSTSRVGASTHSTSQSIKRTREDLDSSMEPDRFKRMKQESLDAVASQSETFAEVEPTPVLTSTPSIVLEVHPRVSSPVQQQVAAQVMEGETTNDRAAVIVLSDEESAEDILQEQQELTREEEEEMEDNIEDEDEEEVGEHADDENIEVDCFGSEEGEGESEHEDHEEGSEEEEEEDSVADEEDDSGDVVIIEDENEDEEPTDLRTTVTPELAVAPNQMTSSSQVHPNQAQVRSQLPSFSFSGAGTGFEDGDDCTVPRTPTLNLPARMDGGFAEAVQSPQVPSSHGFIFSGITISQEAEGSQLQVQEALGMDDTKVDLSNYEEGSVQPGASVQSGDRPASTGPADEATEVTEEFEGDGGDEDNEELEGVDRQTSEIPGDHTAGDYPIDLQSGGDIDARQSRIQPIVWEDSIPTSTVSPTPPIQHAQPILSLAHRPMMIQPQRQRMAVQGRGQSPQPHRGGPPRQGPQPSRGGLRGHHMVARHRGRGRGNRGRYRQSPF